VFVVLAGCGGQTDRAAPSPKVEAERSPVLQAKAACGPGAELATKARLRSLAATPSAPDDAGALALLEQSCAMQDGTGCYGLATAYNIGQGVAVDRKRADELFAKAAPLVDAGCANGCQHDCATLGWTLHTEQGRARDGTRAIELLTKACEAKSPEGCFLLGTMYSFAYEIAADQARAFELYRVACELGDSLGCNGVASHYESGKGVTVDLARATEFHQRACKLGFAGSCAWGHWPMP
jgi:TPR repeat protein